MKLFLLLLISITVKASTPKFLLYDLKNENGIKATYPLKSNRIYIYYDSEFKTWVYTKTNTSGNFTKPLEIYKPGTTLPAENFGIESRDYYSLTENGKWIKYGSYAVQKVLIKDSINREATRYPKNVPMPAPALKTSKKRSK